MDREKIFFAALVLLLATFSSCSSKTRQSEKNVSNAPMIIFETDMGNDVDDALALDMLYKYMDTGSIDLLAVMTNKENPFSAEFLDIMNTWYGYPGIPIGIIRNGADSENDAKNYTQCVAEMKDKNGTPLFRRTLKSHSNLPDAHILYRKILAQLPDNSVTIVSVGFSSNLARLLETPADDFSSLTGKELVAKKVKLLCTMAGCFDTPDYTEYNIVKDIAAAKKVFAEWPTTLVTSPFEVGNAIHYPATSIENDFGWAPTHPMVEAYKCYLQMPYDRPTWDLTSVLYAVEGGSFFNSSSAGKIEVTDRGITNFTTDENGNHFYLMVDSVQVENIKNHFIQLISRQPAHYK